MNCPTCKELIGADQVSALTPWDAVSDDKGIVQSVERSQYLHCDHCGLFKCTESHNGQRSFAGPLHDAREIARAERLIPACKFDRRIPA